MKTSAFLNRLQLMGMDTIAGVPDSTLKQFCDSLQLNKNSFTHYVTANEGAAVGIAIGSYLATGKPACVYMQNSGIGNAVNPICSLANAEVYGIPMLFVVGWRGEPGQKDEPQHVFQGKITCQLFDVLSVPYAVIDQNTTEEEMEDNYKHIAEVLAEGRQFALIVKKGTFEKEAAFRWQNGNRLIREQVLGEMLAKLPRDVVIVSTTGKISRELYEQSEKLYGGHENIFMTVGGMGHASMIALGIAMKRPELSVICVDGDGAALMHMGALPFIASKAPTNFYHFVINNQAHESVGAMPTDCRQVEFYRVAQTVGYQYTCKPETMEDVEQACQYVSLKKQGPAFFEIPVTLDSRPDLGRPRESAAENKSSFMKYLDL